MFSTIRKSFLYSMHNLYFHCELKNFYKLYLIIYKNVHVVGYDVRKGHTVISRTDIEPICFEYQYKLGIV